MIAIRIVTCVSLSVGSEFLGHLTYDNIHHTILDTYRLIGIFLAGFQGQTWFALWFLYYVFLIFLTTWKTHFCINRGYRLPRLGELRTRIPTNLPSYIFTSSLSVYAIYLVLAQYFLYSYTIVPT